MRVTQRLLTLSVISCVALVGMATTANAGGLVLDPYAHMPYAYSTRGVLSADMVAWEDGAVQTRCEAVAKETVPGAFKLGVFTAVNHGVGGLIGGGAGAVVSTNLEYGVLHAAMGPHVLAAVGIAGAANGGIQGAVNGYVGGAESANQQHHATVQGCRLNSTADIFEVPPSIAHKIASGELPAQDFRAPWERGDATASPAPVTQPAAAQ
jgi:hypothetical protein